MSYTGDTQKLIQELNRLNNKRTKNTNSGLEGCILLALLAVIVPLLVFSLLFYHGYVLSMLWLWFGLVCQPLVLGMRLE